MWNQDGYGESFYEEDKFNRFLFGFLIQNSADWVGLRYAGFTQI
jgi:hypothetical protein